MDSESSIIRGKRKLEFLKSFYVLMSILIISSIFAAIALAIPLTERGFYCDDDFITKPYIPHQTVSTFVCAVVSVCMAASAIILIDSFNICYFCTRSEGVSFFTALRSPVIQKYFLITVQCVLFMGCGALVEQTILLMTKKTIGELRPHFIAVCYPNINKYYALCNNITYSTNYIQPKCLDADEDHVKEARMSFPSGHSSFIFYGAVSAILYIRSQRIPISECFKVFCITVQFGYLILAWWVALTRVRDYWHHAWDVLTGALIGSTTAYIIWRCSPLKVKRRQLLSAGRFNVSSRGLESGRGNFKTATQLKLFSLVARKYFLEVQTANLATSLA